MGWMPYSEPRPNSQNIAIVTQYTHLYLFVKEVEGELEAHCLHVGPLEGRGDVHVHVQEPRHRATVLLLLDLQLGQQVHEPLEALLVAVDPEEVDLAQVEHVGGEVVAPPVLALRALPLHQPVTVHDGLKSEREETVSHHIPFPLLTK